MQDDDSKGELTASKESKGGADLVKVQIESECEWHGPEDGSKHPVVLPVNEIALRGVFEISNMLASPSRTRSRAGKRDRLAAVVLADAAWCRVPPSRR
ncbi:hypothetical protein [Bradyrhizobium sp. BR 1432]|uniref:hypothetical protein n=1 Tax=Bradyrhizobium sp. BR 1432 TaxID=3447966 RepID=UPI003EE4D0F2